MTALLLTVIGAAMVLYASFCRLVHTNARTRLSVRAAIWSLSVVAMLALIGPMLTSWRPDLLHGCLLLAFAWQLWVGARVWRYGVPRSFQRGLT